MLKEYAQRDRLDRRDAALATRLCYGVLQNRMLLDFYLSQLVRGRLRDLQPVVLDILRLGLYQIFYMDKIPDSAAVHEAVEQGKQYANPRAAGLVNGVLRGAIRRRGELAEPRDLATRYSHPQPLVELLAGEMGPEELEGVLAADNQAPETVLQGNPLAGDWSQIPAAIQAAGGSCTPHPWLERCFLIAGAGNLERLEIYQKGLCYVQDAASRLAVQCAGVKPGMQVLDSCAAPGGKSFAAAIDMAGQGISLPATSTSISWPLWKRERPGWAFPAYTPGSRTPGSRFRSGRAPWIGSWWMCPAAAWGSSGRSRTSDTRI